MKFKNIRGAALYEDAWKCLTPRKNMKKFFALLMQSALQNYPLAQNEVGISYVRGDGVQCNFERAAYWYKKAASAGCKSAYYNLALLYGYKTTGIQNVKKSIYWMRKAANTGCPDANWQMGCRYLEGEDVAINFKYAMRYFRASAHRGHVDAMIKIAHMYYEGLGVKVNFRVARYWDCKAAEKGNLVAKRNLVQAYIVPR
jgi:TPR repeat protein